MPRRHGGVVTAVAALIALATVTTAPTPASAHPLRHAAAKPEEKTSRYFYIGHAGGSRVRVLGASVGSDLTAASSIEGYTYPAHDDNAASGLDVASGLVKLGAVTTWADAVPVARGTRSITGARTADVSLLGGLIKADAVETVTTATKRRGGGLSASSSTKYVGLTIAGKEYPATLPPDLTIVIPGVAAIVANSSQQYNLAGGTYITGFGLYVSLLKPYKDVPAAATVVLNPTESIVVPPPPPGAPQLGGVGYSSYVHAEVGTALDVDAGPTAYVATPPGGTRGETISNATTDVDVPGVLKADAVTSRTSGVAVKGKGKVKVSNELAGLNLLDGLVTADAVSAGTVVKKNKKGRLTTDLECTLVNLTVAGTAIPAQVPPNTTLELPGVGTLVLNEQDKESWGGVVRALHLTLGTAQHGLPAGAEIEVAASMGWVVGG